MAKKKVSKKGKGNASRATRVRPSYEPRVGNHLGMVIDPCNSVIGPTAYRGKDGFVTRFTGAYGAGSTGACSVVAYWPKYNRIFSLDLASTGTPFALDFYGVAGRAGPGGAFLGTSAAEVRPVGACITSVYTGTELDRQGFIVRGVVPYKSVAGNTTGDSLCNLLQQWNRTPTTEVETKWIPSPDDENYIATPSTLPDIAEDSNIIVHLYRNHGDGKATTVYRVTSILEWQPFYGLGISCPTPNSPDPPAGLERVRSALHSFGNWWLGARAVAGAAARVGRLVARDAVPLIGMARSVPLLTMG